MTQPKTVHPHLPRYAQAVTGLLCVEGVAFQQPWVIVVAAALVAVGRFAPQLSPINRLFRLFLRPTDELEPAEPVRFSQSIALVMLAVAIAALFGGFATVGWVVAGLVAAVALISAVTGWCCGCAVYRLFMLRRGADGDLRAALGLNGTGPWVAVLTAPGCTRCEPVARQLEGLSNQPVMRIDITETAAAAKLPVRSVPAVVLIDADGQLREVVAGRLDRPQLEAVLAAA